MKKFVLVLALLLAFVPIYASAQNVPSLFTKGPIPPSGSGGGDLTNPVGINQGGTGLVWTDPDADQFFGWDDSESAFAGFDPGIALAFDETTVNVVQPPDRIITGTTGEITGADCGKIVLTTNASPVALTVDSAASAGLTEGCAFTLNVAEGGGDATLTPDTSTINGDATLVISENSGCYIRSDGTNYLVDYSACPAIAAAAAGDVTGPASATDNAIARFNLTTGKIIQGSDAILDDNENLSGLGTIASGVNTITASNASALAVGRQGATSPALQVDSSSGTSTSGVKVTAGTSTVGVSAVGAASDVTLGLEAKGSSGTVTVATGSTPTTRMTVNGSAITTTLPLTLGGIETWSASLGAISHITGPTDQNLKLEAGQSAANTVGRGITLATKLGGSPNFGSSVNGGDLTITTAAGQHNSSNTGGRGGDMSITLGAAASFARGGSFSLTTGAGAALGSSQNGSGGDITYTTGAGAASSTATGYDGGRGGKYSITGGTGGVNTGSTNPAGIGGFFEFFGGTGGANTGNGGTAGKGGGFAVTTGAGGNATGASGTRTGGDGGDFQFNPAAGGTGASANGRRGRVGFFTNGVAPQAALDNNGGTFLVRGGDTAPSISSCGTSPSVTGAASSFKLVMGSGTLTACTVNFGQNFATAPNSCTITPADATAAATGTTGAYVSAISTTQVTITGLNLTDADYYVQCF